MKPNHECPQCATQMIHTYDPRKKRKIYKCPGCGLEIDQVSPTGQEIAEKYPPTTTAPKQEKRWSVQQTTDNPLDWRAVAHTRLVTLVKSIGAAELQITAFKIEAEQTYDALKMTGSTDLPELPWRARKAPKSPVAAVNAGTCLLCGRVFANGHQSMPGPEPFTRVCRNTTTCITLQFQSQV